MKYLILFLTVLSNSAFADRRVTVTRISDNKQYSSEFKTQQEAELWKLDNISNNSWGKPSEYIINDIDITSEAQIKKDRENNYKSSLELIRSRLSSGTAKLEDLIMYIKIKENL